MLSYISNILVPNAMAQAADAGVDSLGQGNSFKGLIPLLVIFAVFYFLIIRPQHKKVKQHQEMVKSLKRGDKVVTGGGIIGTVTKVDDDSGILDVDIGGGVIVKVIRATVSDTQVRSVPANDAKPKAPEGKEGKKDKK